MSRAITKLYPQRSSVFVLILLNILEFHLEFAPKPWQSVSGRVNPFRFGHVLLPDYYLFFYRLFFFYGFLGPCSFSG